MNTDTSNDDLLLATIANDGAPPVEVEVVHVPTPPEGALSPAEFTHTEVLDPVVHTKALDPEPEVITATAAPLRTDGPTLEEYVDACYPAETYPPQGYATRGATAAPVDQHAESGYRPVTGQEIQDYVRAKSLGLEGRPSKDDVAVFLIARGV